jgi:RNA polymerase sigma-70 factor (ECF subfamily)
VRHAADEELMMAVRDRADTRAFTILYERHAPVAVTVARKVLSSQAGAEDAVQEAFVAVWRHRASFRSEAGAFRPWLLQIVRNRSIDAVRRDQAHARQRTELDQDTLEAPLPPLRGDPTLRRALQELPPDQYRVLDLAYFVGLTHAAIAEVLDLPLGTVKGRMRLGLARLRATGEVQPAL